LTRIRTVPDGVLTAPDGF